nr:hypothetical protein [Escherichia coli]HEK8257724.1 hypothetical protein [Escherichia coli]HEK8266961.1 hypothetical protein [Escherichia coli]HEK8276357.1 hypothetical protein [Escherichia coli]HEK8290965.1 hypothetical protein [Escherichia coli]
MADLLLSILVPVDAGKYRKGGSVPSQNMVTPISGYQRPTRPGDITPRIMDDWGQ